MKSFAHEDLETDHIMAIYIFTYEGPIYRMLNQALLVCALRPSSGDIFCGESEQEVRGSVILPSSSGINPRELVLWNCVGPGCVSFWTAMEAPAFADPHCSTAAGTATATQPPPSVLFHYHSPSGALQTPGPSCGRHEAGPLLHRTDAATAREVIVRGGGLNAQERKGAGLPMGRL